METDEVREELRAADRAAAAPYTEYPPTPRWYYPAAGAWAAVLVAMLFAPGEHAWLSVGGVLLLAGGLGAYFVWYRAYRGVQPSGRPPREVALAMGGYLIIALAEAVGIAFLALHWYWIAVAATFVLVAVGLWGYERVYAVAARRARERLR